MAALSRSVFSALSRSVFAALSRTAASSAGSVMELLGFKVDAALLAASLLYVGDYCCSRRPWPTRSRRQRLPRHTRHSCVETRSAARMSRSGPTPPADRHERRPTGSSSQPDDSTRRVPLWPRRGAAVLFELIGTSTAAMSRSGRRSPGTRRQPSRRKQAQPPCPVNRSGHAPRQRHRRRLRRARPPARRRRAGQRNPHLVVPETEIGVRLVNVAERTHAARRRSS